MLGLLAESRTRLNLLRHRGRTGRRLEIGPGQFPLEGFETLNIHAGRWTDYVRDAAGALPFDDGTFELVYASHVLEHVPWYQTAGTLAEWVRILAPGGALEIWVPDGLKIARAFVDAETNGHDCFADDPWTKLNDEKDPCKWAAGRLFTYGDDDGNPASPNWHRALFSPRYLRKCLADAGLIDVRLMEPSEVRGADHGWINLGMRGVKP